MDAAAQPRHERVPWWALPMLALGLSLVACGALIPAAEANRVVEGNRRHLEAQVQGLQERATTNEMFLTRLHVEAFIAERLGRRQMPPEPSGDVRSLRVDADGTLSPFALLTPEPVQVAPPAVLGGGLLVDWCLDPRGRLAVIGTGLLFGLFAMFAGGSPVRGGDTP